MSDAAVQIITILSGFVMFATFGTVLFIWMAHRAESKHRSASRKDVPRSCARSAARGGTLHWVGRKG